jgi:hypothetical protein
MIGVILQRDTFIKKKDQLISNMHYSSRNLDLSKKLYVGAAVNVFYFIIFNKKRKYFLFLGLILNINKKKRSLTFINSLKGETIKLKLTYWGPNFLFVERCYKYNFFFKKNTFISEKKISLTNFITYRTKFVSSIKLMEINFYKLLMYNYTGRLGFNITKKKKLKKLRKKFKY